MDKKNIIIIALIIFIFAIIGTTALITHATTTNITVTSYTTLQNGEEFSLKLTDSNNKSIAYKKITVDIIDSNGEHNIQNLTTDENGTAKFVINNVSKGNYIFNCSFNGDFDYKKSNLSQNVTIILPQTQTNNIQTTDIYIIEEEDIGLTHYTVKSDGWVYYYDSETGDSGRFPYIQ